MKLLSGTIRPRLPSCQTCRNASNTTTLVGGKWWEKVPVKQPSCWNSFEKFWSNRHTESSHQFSTWFILIRSAIYDFCQIMTFLTHTKWITSDYLLFILDIATAWRTSDRHFHNSFFFFFHVLKNSSLRIHCPFTKSIQHFCFKEEVLVGKRLLVSYCCHFLERYMCVWEWDGWKSAGWRSSWWRTDTSKREKKPYRQTVLKIQTDKSLQRREARGELSNDPGGKD